MASRLRPTLHDVAKVAGVSPKSISRVLNSEPGVSEETRQRILDAIAKLGYVPNTAARRLRGTVKVIGLIVSEYEEYSGQVVQGMSKAAQHLGYNLVLYVQFTAAGNADSYHALFASGLVGGMLLVVPFDEEVLIGLCEEQSLPYVLIDYRGKEPGESVPTITATNRKGMLEATRYLLALGHRKIGFITGVMTMGSARDRLQGYKDALAEANVPFDPSLVVEGTWSQQSGFSQTRVLLERHPDLTAVIGSDDPTAFGAMDAIKDAGLRVGEDISVIGFDDGPTASAVYPSLTTVRQPVAEMGEAAVELLAALVEGRTPITLKREFSTELIVRHSTGVPPQRS